MKTVCVKVDGKEYNFRITMKVLNDLVKNGKDILADVKEFSIETIIKVLKISSIEKIDEDQAYELCDSMIDQGWGMNEQSCLLVEIMRCSGLYKGYSEEVYNTLKAMGIGVLRKYIISKEEQEKIITEAIKEENEKNA